MNTLKHIAYQQSLVEQSIDFIDCQLQKLYKQLEFIESMPSSKISKKYIDMTAQQIEMLVAKLNKELTILDKLELEYKSLLCQQKE